MKNSVTVGIFAFALNLLGVTPMDFDVPEGKITKIECECKDGTPNIVKGVFKIQKGIYHYRVYLPIGYKENKDKHYKCMFISSASGNARMGNMEKRLKEDNWIVIMLVESKNGPDSPCNGNFIAAHDDAVKRFRIQDGMKYATGMSGGARACTVFLAFRDGFAGVILQGAGFSTDWENVDKNKRKGEYYFDCLKKNKGLAIYGIIGNKDSNRVEIEWVNKQIGNYKYIKFENFDGGHVWAPAECFDNALDWMNEQLIYTTKNKDIILNVFASNLAALDKIDNKFKRYEKLQLLEKIATKHRLNNAPGIKESMNDIQVKLSALKKDKTVALEIKGKTAFDSVFAKEEKYREKLAKGNYKRRSQVREIERLNRAYARVVKMYKDTIYSKKAEEKVTVLEEEKQSLLK